MNLKYNNYFLVFPSIPYTFHPSAGRSRTLTTACSECMKEMERARGP